MSFKGFVKRWNTIKRRIFKTIRRECRAAQSVSEGTRFSCYNCVNIVQSVRLLIIKNGTDLEITGKTASGLYNFINLIINLIPKDNTMIMHNTNSLPNKFYPLYYIRFEITCDPCKLIGSLSEIKSITTFKSLLLFKFLWNED